MEALGLTFRDHQCWIFFLISQRRKSIKMHDQRGITSAWINFEESYMTWNLDLVLGLSKHFCCLIPFLSFVGFVLISIAIWVVTFSFSWNENIWRSVIALKIYTHGIVIVKKWILANGSARNQDNWKCIKARIGSIPYFLFCDHSSYSQRVRIEQQIDEVRGIYFFYNISPGGNNPYNLKYLQGT